MQIVIFKPLFSLFQSFVIIYITEVSHSFYRHFLYLVAIHQKSFFKWKTFLKPIVLYMLIHFFLTPNQYGNNKMSSLLTSINFWPNNYVIKVDWLTPLYFQLVCLLSMLTRGNIIELFRIALFVVIGNYYAGPPEHIYTWWGQKFLIWFH